MKQIAMPVSEVIDRWSIATLKSQRLKDAADRAEQGRMAEEYWEGIPWDDLAIVRLAADIHTTNGHMWDAEAAIRAGQDQQLGLEEIGRRALAIRDLNKERIRLKNEVVALTGTGYRDVKVNYAKTASE